jgi:hypothetical protein
MAVAGACKFVAAGLSISLIYNREVMLKTGEDLFFL